MEQEEKRIEKKEQEEATKNEISPLGEEKMQKKSTQEIVSKENSSRFKVFERYSANTNDTKKYSNQVDVCAFNKPSISDTTTGYLSKALESANR